MNSLSKKMMRLALIVDMKRPTRASCFVIAKMMELKVLFLTKMKQH